MEEFVVYTPVQRPRALIFDWDNTLIDSWAAIHDAQNHTFAAFGLPPWSMEDIRRKVRGSMRDTFPALFGDRWEEAGRIFYERFTERHLATLAPLPGARDLLEFLGDAGWPLAVVSNKKGSYLRLEAEELGWQRYFNRLVGAFDAARDKPAIDPVVMALDGSGVEAGADVWFVGDADIDLACAVNAGCVPVLVREKQPEEDEFGRHSPHVYATGCFGLLNVLRTL